MASTRDLRRRIKSIRNTAQITRAMQMVAASKMRRAQESALAGRPFAELLNKVLLSLRGRADPEQHPLLAERPVKRELVLVVSPDRGLCGGLNTNLLREAAKFGSETTDFVAAGRKGLQFLARTGRNILADFELKETPDFANSKTISGFCMEKFLGGEVDKISVLHTTFVNTLVQRPAVQTIVPISPIDVGLVDEAAEGEEGEEQLDYLYEPTAQDVLGAILPYYVHFQIYQMVLDARASEHSARMVAMKNATDNANQLIKDLTLEYNKIRQAGITSELLDIITAQAALD